MTVRLTRIYTKTGDAGTTHLGDMSRVRQDRPAAGRLRRRRRDQQRARRRPRARRAPSRRSPTCCAASRTTCSTSAPTCAPRSRPTRSTRRCGSPRPTPSGWRRPATSTTSALPQARPASSCPAAPPAAALLHQARIVVRRAERSVWALLAADAGPHQRRDRALPQPALGPAVHPGPGRQPGRRRALGARRAQRRARPAAPRLRRAQRSGGADSTQERKPVTVEVSIASSRGPSRRAAGQDDDVRGQGEVVAAGRRAATPPGARRGASRSCGRTDSESPRYQSRMSPPYQATPTDQPRRAERAAATW